MADMRSPANTETQNKAPWQMIRVWDWLFSRSPEERVPKNEAEKLKLSMRVTSKCRFNASVHLHRRGRFGFFSTTVLSLGLIFIPLMQNSGVDLHFSTGVLNTMQIFLAVAILVYSVVMGTARYELRAEKLNDCGIKLKQLIRDLGRNLDGGSNVETESLKDLQSKYSDITADTENHTRTDYRLAKLEMKNDYFITGVPRLTEYALAYGSRAAAYGLPVIMLCLELIFILDMLGVTEILRCTLA